MPHVLRDTQLPSTAELLVSGGDQRLRLDPQTGASRYGVRPTPDPTLVALGSCTASQVSTQGWNAAGSLRLQLQMELAGADSETVYAAHTGRVRRELLALCAADDGSEAVLAASGTDLFVLIAQWLRPDRTVLLHPSETGSGVPLALQGQHFDARSACGASQVAGQSLGEWQGELATLAVRSADGTPRAQAEVDADCAAAVDAAAGAGRRVLLVVTDASKTGLLAPSIDSALTLRRRWPGLVEIVVDGCQFRLGFDTIRAYLAQDCMVALTGSKFMAGPTFCGALLVPAASVARLRGRELDACCAAYSNRAEWPSDWPAARQLGHGSNLGLLLRWEAALAEIRRFAVLPPALLQMAAAEFSRAMLARLELDPRFMPLAVPTLRRPALQSGRRWDLEQTIFPFLTLKKHADGSHRPLDRPRTAQLYAQLRGSPASAERCYALGQPVNCGELDGQPVSALRLCLSAPLLVQACEGGIDGIIRLALSALDRCAELAERL